MKCPHCGQEVIIKNNTRLIKPKAEAEVIPKAKPGNSKPKAKKKEKKAKL